MLLFRSEEHRDRWIAAGNPRGETFTLEQCWRLARVWYADRLAMEWRRRTVEEAQTVFRGLGLTSGFWDLTANSKAAS